MHNPQEPEPTGVTRRFLSFLAFVLLVGLTIWLFGYHEQLTPHQRILIITIGGGMVMLLRGIALWSDKTVTPTEYPHEFFDARGHLRGGTVTFNTPDNAIFGCLFTVIALLLIAAGLVVVWIHRDAVRANPPVPSAINADTGPQPDTAGTHRP